jgi:Tfp pilus assembly protein PilZ
MDGIGDGHAGRLRVATKARYKSRQAVVLEIGFPGLPNRVLLRATAAGEATAADALFEIVPGEEHKRDFLVAVASGKAQASALHRRHRRFPMRLPARFVVDGGQGVPLRGDAETEDVGPSGVFLKTPRSLPEGARVTVVLDPLDGSAELELTGRVVYTRKPGSDEGSEPGVGVQFDKPTTDDRKRLRRMIRDVKVQGRMVQWEDEAASRKASAQKKGEARK